MLDATFDDPDLTTFTGLNALGLRITGQRLEPDRAVLACALVQHPDAAEADRWCRRCGCEGRPRGTVIRRLAHVPFGHRPTTLQLRLVRFVCTSCGRVWRQDSTAAAEPRTKLTRTALAWALHAIVVQHLTIARVAEALAVSWHTANDAVLAEGQRVLIADPARFDGVAVIGVDEHVWRHTRRGERYVTVVIDLTPVRDGTGPARLLGRRSTWSRAARSRRSRPGWQGAPGLARRHRGRRHGRIQRLQDRHHRRATRGDRGDGPLPRGAPGRGRS